MNMKEDELRKAATVFFDEFVEAFHSFDGHVIARRYLAPYQALQADGSVHWLASREEIGRYFQGIVDGYRRDGCRSCRYEDLAVMPVGANCLLATVTWQLAKDHGEVLSTWRESYNLARTGEGLRVLASIDH